MEKNVDGLGSGMYNDDLTQFGYEGSGAPVYEADGAYQNDEDKWNDANGAAVWDGAQDHPYSYGLLVVDMKVPRYLDRFSIFQTFADGKLTQLFIARHMELGDTPPSALGGGWTDVAPEIFVPAGFYEENESPRYVGGPAKVTVTPFVSRYLRFKVRNNGTHGDTGYIEFKGIKGFGGPPAS